MTTQQTTSAKLSPLAEKLLSYLRSSGGDWEGHCLDHCFNKPAYASDPAYQRIYWQWEANAYGTKVSRRIGEFTPSVAISYSKQISAAYRELREAGLADEKNSGYNDYYYFPVN